MRSIPAPGLYAIVDVSTLRARGIEDVLGLAAALTRGGASIVQLRAKTPGADEFLALARAMAPVVRDAGASFVVNDRVDVAALAGADGVHLGQDDLPVAEARRILGERALIGLSTHDLAQLRAAQTSGADYVGFGPVFATRSKETRDAVQGIEGLSAAVRASRLPVAAIGGIRLEAASSVRDSGARWAAVISDLLADRDAEKRARAFVVAMAR
jgi:thiamine-phosphate pyrophosphorylase